MKIILKILMIILPIAIISTTAYASNFDIKIEPEIIVTKENETIEINISFKDIDMNDAGINTVEGFIKYDKDIIDSIELINENNWQVKYNSDEQSDLYGKFLSIKDISGITESETFLKLKIKLKSKLSKEEGYILLDEITSNDGDNLINIGKKEIKIKIEKDINQEEQSEDNKQNEQSEDNKQNEQSEDNKQNEQSEDNKQNEQSEDNKQNEQSEDNKQDDVNKDSKQEKTNENKNNIKTGDVLPPIAIGTIIATIIINSAINVKKSRR